MTSRITLKNSVKIVDNEYVIKSKKQSLENIFTYLDSRSFNYFPPILKEEDNYIYYGYIKDIDTPLEQKLIDIIILASILHDKTTIYKEVDIDYYKYIYESINNKIVDTYNYYQNLISNIEKEVYMSPSNYLIAKNISIIFSALTYTKESVDKWYKLVKDKEKVRLSVIHNNLSIDHYLKNKKPYLISWDNTKIDMPIYDMINLYQKHAIDFDFKDIFKLYLEKYPYTKEEMTLFLTLIAIPSKIELVNNEYTNVININKKIAYLSKTHEFLKEYRIKEKTNKS